MLSEHAKKLIARQQRIYIDSMPSKKKAIQQCMMQVKTAEKSGESDLCDKLFQHVHRLAGSAGSYGLDALGEAASAVDRYLIAHSPGAGEPAVLTAKLKKLLVEIDKVIQTHA
jgi:HPt (histidine-containing phosphotransfer) domain-containing protein